MTESNKQIVAVGKNIQDKAALIWNVANTLFGAFKPHEYGLLSLIHIQMCIRDSSMIVEVQERDFPEYR